MRYVLELKTEDGSLVDSKLIECKDDTYFLVVQEQEGESRLVAMLRTLANYKGGYIQGIHNEEE